MQVGPFPSLWGACRGGFILGFQGGAELYFMGCELRRQRVTLGNVVGAFGARQCVDRLSSLGHFHLELLGIGHCRFSFSLLGYPRTA